MLHRHLARYPPHPHPNIDSHPHPHPRPYTHTRPAPPPPVSSHLASSSHARASISRTGSRSTPTTAAHRDAQTGGATGSETAKAKATTTTAGRQQSSSSSEETEEGFVVVGDEFGAPWDGDQTKYPPPTLVSKAVQSTRCRWGSLSLSSLQGSLGSAASSLAGRALAAVPSSAHQHHQPERQPSIQDVSGWEPESPRNAFVVDWSKVPGCGGAVGQELGSELSGPSSSSRETKLQAYRAQLEEEQRLRLSEPAFVRQEQGYGPLGDSVAWQRPVVRGGGEGRKKTLLEEWKARDERGQRERLGRVRSSTQFPDMPGDDARNGGSEEEGQAGAAFGDPRRNESTAAGMERGAPVMLTMPSETAEEGYRVRRASRGGRSYFIQGSAGLE